MLPEPPSPWSKPDRGLFVIGEDLKGTGPNHQTAARDEIAVPLSKHSRQSAVYPPYSGPNKIPSWLKNTLDLMCTLVYYTITQTAASRRAGIRSLEI